MGLELTMLLIWRQKCDQYNIAKHLNEGRVRLVTYMRQCGLELLAVSEQTEGLEMKFTGQESEALNAGAQNNAVRSCLPAL